MSRKSAVDAVIKKFPDFDVRDIKKGMIKSESYPYIDYKN